MEHQKMQVIQHLQIHQLINGQSIEVKAQKLLNKRRQKTQRMQKILELKHQIMEPQKVQVIRHLQKHLMTYLMHIKMVERKPQNKKLQKMLKILKTYLRKHQIMELQLQKIQLQQILQIKNSLIIKEEMEYQHLQTNLRLLRKYYPM